MGAPKAIIFQNCGRASAISLSLALRSEDGPRSALPLLSSLGRLTERQEEKASPCSGLWSDARLASLEGEPERLVWAVALDTLLTECPEGIDSSESLICFVSPVPMMRRRVSEREGSSRRKAAHRRSGRSRSIGSLQMVSVEVDRSLSDQTSSPAPTMPAGMTRVKEMSAPSSAPRLPDSPGLQTARK